jgi:ferredoxin--NADP+ reductase
MDVVRILARTEEELQETDIADYALEALRNSNIKEIYVLGRRGPAQAAFTNPEIKELGELAGADVIVPHEDIELDPLSQAFIQLGEDRTAEHNVQILTTYAQQCPGDKPKRIIMRFLVSPVEIIGTERVEAIRIVKNELYQRADGSLRPRPTNEYETIPVGLVFRSIGYHGVALPDVPFDESSGTIPNAQGRVIGSEGSPLPGEYVVGWIKRGPTGIIGTNKHDAQETVALLLEDITHGCRLNPIDPSPEAVETKLRQRGVRYVTFGDWQILDQLERERGEACGRMRLKFSRVEEMLEALNAQSTITGERRS